MRRAHLIGLQSEVRPLDVEALLRHLPPLPSNVRYYDSVQGKYQSLRAFPNWKSLTLNTRGRTRTHDFSHLGEDAGAILRHVVADFFSRIDAVTVSTHLGNLKASRTTEQMILKGVALAPADFRAWWIENCATQLTERQCGAFKAVLRTFCNLVIGHWNPDYREFVSQLPSPPKNRYGVLEAGVCFLPIEHQAKLTNWLDDLAAEISSNPLTFTSKRLREFCALTLSYQFGFRPIQIADIKVSDVSMRNDRVYVRVLIAKQRDAVPQHVTRRIKPEWSAGWIEHARRRPDIEPAPHAHRESFLGLPPDRISTEISAAMERITGKRWTPNDLRHTGAQRLADAGASHSEIQDYLTHATDGAANAYFTGSGLQAEKVNRAMGLSQLYQSVAHIANIGMIDRTTLEMLPEARQIGGIPHGIPIAGIGACELGQSHCIKNPVLSCYGCRNFLPLNEPLVHEEVADGLRGVVQSFFRVASDVDASPAYGQLRRTIEAADRIAVEARGRKISGLE